MSKTPFSKKVEILGNFYLVYSEDTSLDEGWKDFFTINDIGLPLAFFAHMKVATVTKPDGVSYVEKTWERFCELLSIDPDGRYADVQDMFEISSRVRDE